MWSVFGRFARTTVTTHSTHASFLTRRQRVFLHTPPATAATTDKKLFTPGPLGTTSTIKSAMLRDLGSRDTEFVSAVSEIRSGLLEVAGVSPTEYTCVLQQGSGTFAVESVLSTCIPRDPNACLFALVNGAYGKRIAHIARVLGVNVVTFECAETEKPDLKAFADKLAATPNVTNVAAVHCETSSGVINPVEEIGQLVQEYTSPTTATATDAATDAATAAAETPTYFVDAMSSFGAIPIDMEAGNIDYLVSSANKCIEGVPGFGYAIARRSKLMQCEGWARSVSLDLVDQLKGLDSSGQFRFTPATHTMLAFRQALREHKDEGGVAGRGARYAENKHVLREGMARMGFKELLGPELSAENYIITSYALPSDHNFSFKAFYDGLNERDLVIYPGKVTAADCFRIGTIGQIYPDDVRSLLAGIELVADEMGVKLPVS